MALNLEKGKSTNDQLTFLLILIIIILTLAYLRLFYNPIAITKNEITLTITENGTVSKYTFSNIDELNTELKKRGQLVIITDTK